mgnify:FL=1
MKLFEKVKNMFTEEIEEEKPVIKKEVRHVEIPTPKVEEKEVEEKKEEKLLFFDDKDFEDLEREEEKIIKPLPKKEEPLPYKGVKPVISDEPKKVFKPSPIISPVYGVLDKNYKKDDIITKKSPRSSYHSENITVDDVRKRAFSTLEDDLKNEILEDDYIVSKREVVEDDLDIFKDIEENEDEVINNKKVDIVDNDAFEDDLLDDTEYLSKKLEEQKRKLDEINDIINDNQVSKTRSVDEYLYREQEREVKEKSDTIEETEVVENKEISEEPKIIDEKEIIEEPEVIEEDVIEEPKIEEDDSSINNEEESPKSLDEAYKDAFDDIEEASTKTEQKEKKKQDMSDSELLNLIDSMYEKSEDDE